MVVAPGSSKMAGISHFSSKCWISVSLPPPFSARNTFSAPERPPKSPRVSALRPENLCTIALTGALNRGGIVRVAEQALKNAAETSNRVGLIMVDIDHFKAINDSLGHGAGDMALKEFSRRLAHALRQNDQFGRYGGEEFLVVVSVSTAESLTMTMERLRRAIFASPFVLGSERRKISASFGGVLATGTEASVEELIVTADTALYEAKNAGRNRVVLASCPKVAAGTDRPA